MWLAGAFGDVVDERLDRDPFDPRQWPEYWLGSQSLPLGDGCNAPIVTLDYEDYRWATTWLWGWTTSRRSPTRRHKVYARRNTGGGVYGGVKTAQAWLWLHKEICFRAHGPPPSLFHTIADHKNGDTLNCRRSNLRWATPAENRANLYGQAFRPAEDRQGEILHAPVGACAAAAHATAGG